MELIRQLEITDSGIELAVAYKRPVSCKEFADFLHKKRINTYILYDSFDLSRNNLFRTAKEFLRIFRTERPNVIHMNFGNSIEMLAIRLLTLFRGVKIIRTEHCQVSIDSKRRYLVYKLINALSSRILCVSQAITRSINDGIGSHKAQTLYLGVPDRRYDKTESRQKLNLPLDKVIICNIAYHDRVKGVDVLIRVIDYLKNTLGQTDFMVLQIGGAPFKEQASELQELLGKTDLSDAIEFWGIRNDIDVILSAADIYCQPSRSEGIPLSIMEASIAGLPIVATNVGGIPEAAREGINALLSDSEDYVSIAENLQKLIIDPARRAEMGRKGREFALQDFAIECQAARLLAIYKQL